MTLLEAIANAEPGAIPRTPFYAELRGEQVLIRCVLERTAVYEHDGERHLALLHLFEPVGDLEWFTPRPPARRYPTAEEHANRGRESVLRRRGPMAVDCMGGHWCGTSSGYNNHSCRGEACRTAATEARRLRTERERAALVEASA